MTRSKIVTYSPLQSYTTTHILYLQRTGPILPIKVDTQQAFWGEVTAGCKEAKYTLSKQKLRDAKLSTESYSWEGIRGEERWESIQTAACLVFIIEHNVRGGKVEKEEKKSRENI